MEKTLKILNQQGLHARPAAILTKTAAGFKSDIHILYKDITANAKSIMNIMSLGLNKDAEFVLAVNGPDEEKAFDTIVQLIESKFGEE
ncbi:MAG: HPr family phosphocarrier protein [Bacillota bacterium]